jgi:hypothetical protein
MPKKIPQDKKTARDVRGITRNGALRSGTPRSVADIMSKPGLLSGLRQARVAQEDWLAWLQARLPPELSEAARQAIPKGEELVVLATTAAWSSRLRYALAALEPDLAAAGTALKRISVRVAPSGRSGAGPAPGR